MTDHAQPSTPASSASPEATGEPFATNGGASDSDRMRAMVIRQYGEASRFEAAELQRPHPGDEEVVIRVHAAGVNPIDWRLRNGSLRWINPARFPLVLGFDVAGTITEVGSTAAQRWEIGQEVLCFLDHRHGGGYAEFARANHRVVARKPPNISFEEAAGVPLAAITALQSMRDHGKLSAGKHVLIHGASGGVGTFAVQIAKVLDANVTAVCSGRNESLVRELGADDFIDYTRHDFEAGNTLYDLVFDAVAKASFRRCRHILPRDGYYVSTLPSLESSIFQVASYFRGPACRNMLARPNGPDLEDISRWIEQGRIRAVVQEVFPLEDAAEAHRLSEAGHVTGKLVLRGFD